MRLYFKQNMLYLKIAFIFNFFSMKAVGMIAMILTVVGALNWGLVGLGGFLGMNLNLVNLIFGAWASVEWIVYLLVGISGILVAWAHGTGKCAMK